MFNAFFDFIWVTGATAEINPLASRLAVCWLKVIILVWGKALSASESRIEKKSNENRIRHIYLYVSRAVQRPVMLRNAYKGSSFPASSCF